MRPSSLIANDGPLRRFDEPPCRPVEFKDAARAADVDDPSPVLHDRPVLAAAAYVLRPVGADERPPFFRVTRRR
jgi:hypothetical protein